MISPTSTANNLYTFDTEYAGKPMKEWVTAAHKDMSLKSGWKYFPLSPGTFGYDNQAHSLGHVFDNYEDGMNRDQIACLVHEGWCINYLFWRDHKPWLKDKSYKAPSKPLNDKRRNECTAQTYDQLPQDEKDKDLMIADYILSQTQ